MCELLWDRRDRRVLSSRIGRAIAGLVVLLMSGCAHHYHATPAVNDLPALQLADNAISPGTALEGIVTPDLLGLSPEMREFVDRYISHGNDRQRMLTLHRSLRTPAMVDVTYDPGADGTAADVFASGAANCLSYAHMFVALGRYAGLDVHYQSLELRPEWARHGNQIALRRHVNVRVDLRRGEQYMVDIDPVSRARVASAGIISDDAAAALYHANHSMDALLQGNRARAFGEALRALELAPDIDYLWVNLGAIYRESGQDQAAEQVLRAALEVNPDSRPAMNNLAVLFHARGDLEEGRYWEDRVRARREANPYYHYHLGEQAEESGALDDALEHYLTAIRLKDSDAEFYYRVARVYYAQHKHEETVIFLEKAIDRSSLVGERDEYREFLKRVSTGVLTQATHSG